MYFQYIQINILLRSLLRSPRRVLHPARHTPARHTERFATRSCTHVVARAHMGVSPFTRICSCARQSCLTRPHRHQVLGRHLFSARKRLQKQGLKTIGTKTCFAHIHTYPPARKDSAGETISAVRRGLVTQLLLRGHTWVSRRSHGNIVCIYKISVSTYCCFAVALSVPRAALPRHIFYGNKAVAKARAKNNRNQTLQREHTHIYTASPHGSHSACTDMLCVG